MKLSICMMVKNESKYLDMCLKSIQPLLDAVESELIIIDTGSEDDTVEIARKYTDKVYFHEWYHDFSGMRNKTISYATGEWIFILDADEVLQETQPIIDFLQAPKNKKTGGVAFACKSITNENNLADYSITLTIRLFKNDGYFHYAGVVHNQPVFKGKVIEIETSLLHYGYMATDKDLMEKKFLRTNVLLKNELEKDPENTYYWFQLSVSYGMHNDIEKAIEYIQTAYDIFIKQGKPDNCMYVMTHFVHMSQLIGNYEKVEKLCLESLEIKSGYLDIYYYLAESQTVLGKYQESIENFHKYLDLLVTRDQTNKKDLAVSDYTVGVRDNAYYNLSVLYRKTFNYAMSLEYAQKVEKAGLIRENFKNITNLFIRQGQYGELKKYYNTRIEKDWYMLFYEKMEETISEFDHEVKVTVAREFADVEDDYGLLSCLIVESQNNEFSIETVEKIANIDFSQILLCYSDILYYLLKKHYPLTQILTHFKEIWINSLLDDLVKRHADLSTVLYEYLGQYHPEKNNSEYKLSKTLCRYVLAIDKMTDEEYQEIFNRYVRDGISYMEHTYNSCVLTEELVYEVKNDEEVFFVYMYQATVNERVNKAEYVKYLRQALEVLPMIKKGIEKLLTIMQTAEQQSDNEMENYKIEVKNTIKQLIDNDQLNDAEALIADYLSIVPKDIEIVLLKSQLLLKTNLEIQ